MVGILELWLPILISAVLIFIASSLIHMVIPIHKGDYGKLPGEEEILAEMRKQGVERGEYAFPGCHSPKEMGTPEMKEKLERGPVGFLTVLPSGGFNIGKNLVQWFLYTIVVGIFVAYVTGRTLGPGTEYMHVFQIAGTAAFMTHALAAIPGSIWKGIPWTTTAKFVFDGAVYALLTAGSFAGFWPEMG